jgi:hypothetical protein
MLDDIKRRRFLVKPARKYLAPFFITAKHDQLDKRPSIGFLLPRRGRFAGFQSYNDITDAHSLPRFHRQIAPQPVAFVKQANRCDALSHWGQGFYRGWFRRDLWRGWFWRGSGLWCRRCRSFGRFSRWLCCVLERRGGLPGKACTNSGCDSDDDRTAHQASGLQAS